MEHRPLTREAIRLILEQASLRCTQLVEYQGQKPSQTAAAPKP
jgi:hypothetical protein